MEEPLVKLIVKASNQQFEDQTIECQLHWTVRKLKEHLFDVYPSKPKPDDQKLIYSGQLLKDKLILKDILRHYEGIQSQTHTFHLVCTPKPRFPIPFGSFPSQHPKATTNQQQNVINDGLRQRQNIQRTTTTAASSGANAATVTNTTTSQMNASNASFMQNNTIPVPMVNTNCAIPSSTVGNISSPFNALGFNQQYPVPNDYVVAQQVAMQSWMQQAYIQYMNQYMNLLSTGVRPETVFMSNQGTSTGNTFNGMPYLPVQGFPFANFGSNLPTTITQTAGNPVTVASATASTIPVQSPPSAPAQIDQQQQQQPQPPQQNQPRFPNIIHDDLQENRDWLDVFYSISRLMVLLTLVYLYSSPIRCLLVFLIGMAIYLYHTVYFRVQGQQQDDNNNRRAVAPQQNIDQQQQQQQHNVQQQNENNDVVDNNSSVNAQDVTATASTSSESANETGESSQTAAANNEREAPVSRSHAANVPEDTDGTSMIAFLKTFVVSFIVSLLPETPPV